MSYDLDTMLAHYAELAINVGLNLQPGQRLLMWRVPPESAPLARLVAAKAYDAGASLVDVMWEDDGMNLARFNHAPRHSFDEYMSWQSDGMEEHIKGGGALISIRGNDPDLLKGQDPELVNKVQRRRWQLIEPTMHYVTCNRVNWLVIGTATGGWARKVFPDIPAADAVSKLWDTIFELCRLDQPDPVQAWQDHISSLRQRSHYLNTKQYLALKYKGPGTDLTLGLPKGHIWKGARSDSELGIPFTPNLPTEEIFTLPHRLEVEGIVSASLPLNYGGTLIEDFSVRFEQGRAVSVSASKGEEILQAMIDSDEGAAYLGEVALVAHSTPIAQTQRLYYNTLYDENAASHVALGCAYNMNLQGADLMSQEELLQAGCNYSLIHVDFMIGSDALDIDGVREDGQVEPVMRAGEWAFDM